MVVDSSRSLVLSTIRTAGSVALVLADTLASTVRRPPRPRVVLEQMHEIGQGSLFFIATTLGFLGLISVYQGATQVMKVLPDLTLVGAAFIDAVVREFAPTIAGLMLATKVGSGIAAQVGTMKVTDQTDALLLCNTNVVEYVVVPRFVASLVATPLLTVIGATVAIASGFAMGYLRFHISPGTFLSLALTDFRDLYIGLAKTVTYGAVVPVVATEAGLSARRGAEGVGDATTRAVVNCSFTIILLDFVISWIGRAV